MTGHRLRQGHPRGWGSAGDDAPDASISPAPAPGSAVRPDWCRRVAAGRRGRGALGRGRADPATDVPLLLLRERPGARRYRAIMVGAAALGGGRGQRPPAAAATRQLLGDVISALGRTVRLV